MDLLITLHRRFQKVVDVLNVRPLASRIFRRLLARRYSSTELVRASQNGRQWWLTPEVALRGEFAEFETIEWLRAVIKPGMTVIDVGANVGQMTLEMAHLVGPRGRVFAIEPAPGNVRVLYRHIQGNGFDDRVTLIEAACSENDGETIEMKIFGDTADTVGSGHTVILDENLTSTRRAMPTVSTIVPTVSIDGLCRRHSIHPDVLKIDVEGAELLVLRGATQILSDAKPLLRFGFHPFAFAEPVIAASEILNLLDSCGYKLTDPSIELPLALEEYSAAPLCALIETICPG